MKKVILISLIFIVALLDANFCSAQDASLEPVITDDGAIMSGVSDNGMWAAGYLTDGGDHYNASIWNLETLERNTLV